MIKNKKAESESGLLGLSIEKWVYIFLFILLLVGVSALIMRVRG